MDSFNNAFIKFMENRIDQALSSRISSDDVMGKLDKVVDWRMHDDVVAHIYEETMKAYKQGLRDGFGLSTELREAIESE